MKAQNMLVIGNGFDMFLGLNSSYKSFFGLNNKEGTYYDLNFRFKSLKDTISKYKYSPIIIEYNDFLLINRLFNIPKATSSIVKKHIYNKDKTGVISREQYFWNSIKDYNKKSIFQFGKLSHVNFWASYFILRKYNKDTDWYSIESEMYNFLTNRNTDFYEIAEFLYYMLTGHQYNFNRINSFMWKLLPTHSSGAILDRNEFSKRNNNEYVYSNDRNFTIGELKKSTETSNENHPWLKVTDVYSLVLLLLNVRGKYFHNIDLFNGDKSNNFKNLCCNLYNFLKNELTLFERDLDGYLLHTCIKGYRNKYKISYNIIGQRLLNGMASREPFSLVDFNYTTPFIEDYDFPDVKSIRNKLLVLRRNIHGRLISPDSIYYDTRKAPIIGISSTNIDINSPIYKFTKNYRIMRLSCNKYGNVFSYKSNIKEIKFFGQSFDAADYDYFFDIFDQFHINDSHVKLVFFYSPHGGQSDDESAINQINNIDTLFTHYCMDRLDKNNKYAKRLLHTLSFEGRLIVINIHTQINKYPLLRRYVDTINVTLIIDHMKNIVQSKGHIDKNKLTKFGNYLHDLGTYINHILRSCRFRVNTNDVEFSKRLISINNKLSKKFTTFIKSLIVNNFSKCKKLIPLIIKDSENLKNNVVKLNEINK